MKTRTPVQPFFITRTIAGVRKQVAAWRRQGLTIGVVPTMGALHEGHLSLLDKAREQCDRTIVTLFVNPIQFGPDEDYERYPREEASDAEKVRNRGCDLLFAPAVEEMFPNGYDTPAAFPTVITVRGLSDVLCGAFRPGHFQGVATEVTKLLLITLPDVAYFGEKDFQQLQVIRTMVRDLNIPVRIEAVPTVREADGLAMSSRNQYLTPEERKVAPLLYQVLLATRRALTQPGANWEEEMEKAKQTLLAGGFRKVEYLSVVDAETLAPISRLDRPARIMAACWLNQTRLIDNIPLDPLAPSASTDESR